MNLDFPFILECAHMEDGRMLCVHLIFPFILDFPNILECAQDTCLSEILASLFSFCLTNT